MAGFDILNDYKTNDINTFKQDITQLMRIIYGMNKFYRDSNKTFDKYMPKFEELIKLYNKKYNLKFVIATKIDEIKVRIFIKENDIKEIFTNTASKISGLRSIGAYDFGSADISEQEKFSSELEKVKGQIYISYYDVETGASTVFLSYDEKEKILELCYDPNVIIHENSAEFKLCAFYALQNSDINIDLDLKTSSYGFTDLLEFSEYLTNLGKFNPRLEE